MKYRVGSVYRIRSNFKGQSKSYDALCIESRTNPLDTDHQIIGLINLSTMKRSDYLIDKDSEHFEFKNQKIIIDVTQEDQTKSIDFSQVKHSVVTDVEYCLKSVTYYKNKIEYNEDPVIIVENQHDSDNKLVDFKYLRKSDDTVYSLSLEDGLAIARVPFGVRIYYFTVI